MMNLNTVGGVDLTTEWRHVEGKRKGSTVVETATLGEEKKEKGVGGIYGWRRSGKTINCRLGSNRRSWGAVYAGRGVDRVCGISVHGRFR